MRRRPPIAGSVVVITGASSGIGRAAARLFADGGARVVLAARGEEDLRAAAAECEAAGAEAEAVPTDVTDEAAVERLAARAVERFGRIDTWVNNAGVIMYGRFEDVTAQDFRRVIEVNLFGQVHGARAVLPHFRRQASGGLINMSSVWGRVTSPAVSAYVTSKFAVRAFSEALRYEMADAPDIHVTTFLPQAVDTPIFDHAANHTGHAIRPIPPILDPEAVAKGILQCAVEPKREVTWARSGRVLETIHVALPPLYDRMGPAMFLDGSLAEPATPQHPDGNLHTSLPGAVHGGWRTERRATLARAFLAAARGGLRGLAGRSP